MHSQYEQSKSMPSPDKRPKTVVLHQQTGIGDLIWHIPYIRAVAAHSQNNQVALIAAPTTLAKQLLAPEPCVNEVIDYYHLPRTLDKDHKRKNRIARMRQIVDTLKQHQFDRIVLFSGRTSRGLLAFWSGIPQRLGYGYRFTQRIFLNTPPYIDRFLGKSNPIYHEASAFCIAHGFCNSPIVPKMTIPLELQTQLSERLKDLPRPLYTLAIGSSETYKQWGADNYAKLAQTLADRGFGVLILGGKMDHEMALSIQQKITSKRQPQVKMMTDVPILQSAAALKCSDVCIGNDTGLCQIAVACDCLCYVIMGPRPTLDHDPLQHYVLCDQLLNITTDQILAQLAQTPAPGF